MLPFILYRCVQFWSKIAKGPCLKKKKKKKWEKSSGACLFLVQLQTYLSTLLIGLLGFIVLKHFSYNRWIYFRPFQNWDLCFLSLWLLFSQLTYRHWLIGSSKLTLSSFCCSLLLRKNSFILSCYIVRHYSSNRNILFYFFSQIRDTYY